MRLARRPHANQHDRRVRGIRRGRRPGARALSAYVNEGLVQVRARHRGMQRPMQHVPPSGPCLFDAPLFENRRAARHHTRQQTKRHGDAMIVVRRQLGIRGELRDRYAHNVDAVLMLRGTNAQLAELRHHSPQTITLFDALIRDTCNTSRARRDREQHRRRDKGIRHGLHIHRAQRPKLADGRAGDGGSGIGLLDRTAHRSEHLASKGRIAL